MNRIWHLITHKGWYAVKYNQSAADGFLKAHISCNGFQLLENRISELCSIDQPGIVLKRDHLEKALFSQAFKPALLR